MTISDSLPIVAASDLARSAMRVPPGKNARNGNGLGGDRLAGGARENVGAAPTVHLAVSYSGTESRTPMWDGPRLTAAFVAQALGQVMAGGAPDPRSALAAYERDHIRGNNSLLLDSEI
jgi:hypothetical protein